MKSDSCFYKLRHSTPHKVHNSIAMNTRFEPYNTVWKELSRKNDMIIAIILVRSVINIDIDR
jgi:hypothetical protein